MTYPEIIQSLATSLTGYFDTVYHSVEIITDENKSKMPAYPSGDEYLPLIDLDQQEYVYIRRNGDDEVFEEEKLSSCKKAYKMRTPLRIVYSRDNASNQAEVLYKLMQGVLIQGTKIKGVVRDKFKLAKDESSAKFSLSANTIYLAVDVFVFWSLRPDNCDQDFCFDLENPLKNCS